MTWGQLKCKYLLIWKRNMQKFESSKNGIFCQSRSHRKLLFFRLSGKPLYGNYRISSRPFFRYFFAPLLFTIFFFIIILFYLFIYFFFFFFFFVRSYFFLHFCEITLLFTPKLKWLNACSWNCFLPSTAYTELLYPRHTKYAKGVYI